MSDYTQIVSARSAKLWLAPVGTTAPTDVTASFAAGWYDVGALTEDSLQFVTSPEFLDIRSADSDYPTRTIQTSESANLTADLQQWNTANFKAVFGGGAVTEPTTGVFKYTPPIQGARAEVAACIEVFDNDKKYRFVFARAFQREGVTTNLQKGGEAKLALRLTILGDSTNAPFIMLTNDDAFDPGA